MKFLFKMDIFVGLKRCSLHIHINQRWFVDIVESFSFYIMSFQIYFFPSFWTFFPALKRFVIFRLILSLTFQIHFNLIQREVVIRSDFLCFPFFLDVSVFVLVFFSFLSWPSFSVFRFFWNFVDFFQIRHFYYIFFFRTLALFSVSTGRSFRFGVVWHVRIIFRQVSQRGLVRRHLAFIFLFRNGIDSLVMEIWNQILLHVFFGGEDLPKLLESLEKNNLEILFENEHISMEKLGNFYIRVLNLHFSEFFLDYPSRRILFPC